ncbi:MAG: integrase arm-type DNA-binding domain-containing protein, partial [Gammaproteobacteria bacterium]|nr:integrase arm-type DNA-binding domain-containing protein [Gammaproteobacteria bacterium]
MPTDRLTDAAIRNAKPRERTYKMFDGKGLYLEVSPKGGKWWRLKYRFAGKEKRLSFGVYPEVPLAGRKDPRTGQWIEGARDKRDRARQLLADGIDPSAQRRAERATQAANAENSFEAVAREWHQNRLSAWSEGHAARILRRLEADIFPRIGSSPIAELTAPQLLSALRRVENRGAVETAHRELQTCGQILRYAVATGRAERDVSHDLRGALPPVKSKHLAAITEPSEVAPLLRMIDAYEGTATVSAALRLAPLVFVRPGELRNARWADIDLDAAEWRYEVTKTKTQHIVPLSTQAVAILADLYPITGNGPYVFPSARSRKRPMSDNAILAALRRMGIPKDEMSGHGFRAMARTILDEVLGFRPDYIEHQLAHSVRDPNGRAYNRTAHLPERHKMMQAWSDYLDALKAGGDVVSL